MAAEKIKRKGFINPLIDTNAEIDEVNKHTIKPLTQEEVYLFKVQLCDNDVDRVGDKMTDHFLEQVASKVSGLTGLKDHDWSSDNQISRLYGAEVCIDPNKLTVLGEPRKYVLGKAYTLRKYQDYIEKIDAGLLKESSVSFESEGDTCSICGEEMVKDEIDIGHCCNGHCAGEVYEGNLCYNKLDNLKDMLEWSLVAVPCQKESGIAKKKFDIGGQIMKKAEALRIRMMASKGYGEEDKMKAKKAKEELDEDIKVDEDMSDDDIKDIIKENVKLREKMKALEKEREVEKKKALVGKGIDEMKPITPEVKELLMKDIDWDSLDMDDGEIPGLGDVFAGMKKKYKGLFVDADTIADEAGHAEPDGDEAAVLTINDDLDEEPDGDEDKIMVVDNTKSKSKRKPGIGFTSGNKSTTSKSKQAIKPGIHWN